MPSICFYLMETFFFFYSKMIQGDRKQISLYLIFLSYFIHTGI